MFLLLLVSLPLLAFLPLLLSTFNSCFFLHSIHPNTTTNNNKHFISPIIIYNLYTNYKININKQAINPSWKEQEATVRMNRSYQIQSKDCSKNLCISSTHPWISAATLMPSSWFDLCKSIHYGLINISIFSLYLIYW